MLYVACSKISGMGAFTDRLLRPGIPILGIFSKINDLGLNHSCQPNCLIVRDQNGHAQQIVPISFIQKGEELTVDYRAGIRRYHHSERVMLNPPSDCDPCRCPACIRSK